MCVCLTVNNLRYVAIQYSIQISLKMHIYTNRLSDVQGWKGWKPDPGPDNCSVFLHAEKFTSSVSSQSSLLQIGEQINH